MSCHGYDCSSRGAVVLVVARYRVKSVVFSAANMCAGPRLRRLGRARTDRRSGAGWTGAEPWRAVMRLPDGGGCRGRSATSSCCSCEPTSGTDRRRRRPVSVKCNWLSAHWLYGQLHARARVRISCPRNWQRRAAFSSSWFWQWSPSVFTVVESLHLDDDWSLTSSSPVGFSIHWRHRLRSVSGPSASVGSRNNSARRGGAVVNNTLNSGRSVAQQ